jgi:hypothetical protein
MCWRTTDNTSRLVDGNGQVVGESSIASMAGRRDWSDHCISVRKFTLQYLVICVPGLEGLSDSL